MREPCPDCAQLRADCARKDAALREARGAIGALTYLVPPSSEVKLKWHDDALAIIDAALAPAAPDEITPLLGGVSTAGKWKDGTIDTTSNDLAPATKRLEAFRRPPAAPEPEHKTIDLMQVLKDHLAKLAAEQIEMTPVQRQCLQQAIEESGDPAPEPPAAVFGEAADRQDDLASADSPEEQDGEE